MLPVSIKENWPHVAGTNTNYYNPRLSTVKDYEVKVQFGKNCLLLKFGKNDCLGLCTLVKKEGFLTCSL